MPGYSMSQYECGPRSWRMFCAPQATWKNPDWVLVQKILHKKCFSETIL
jgi:hypothetical protein